MELTITFLIQFTVTVSIILVIVSILSNFILTSKQKSDRFKRYKFSCLHFKWMLFNFPFQKMNYEKYLFYDDII